MKKQPPEKTEEPAPGLRKALQSPQETLRSNLEKNILFLPLNYRAEPFLTFK